MPLPDSTIRSQIVAQPSLRERITSIQQAATHAEVRDPIAVLASTMTIDDLLWSVAANGSVFASIRAAVDAAAPEDTNVIATAVAAISDNDLTFVLIQAVKAQYNLT